MGVVNEKTFLNAYDEDHNRNPKVKGVAAATQGKVAGKGLLFDLKGKEPSNGVITWPEFSTFVGMEEKKKTELQAQMRMIFDGVVPHRLGNNKEIVWRGKCSMIAAVTPDGFKKAWGLQSDLGDRFLVYRMKEFEGNVDNLAMVDKVQKMMGKMGGIKERQKSLIWDIVEGEELTKAGLEFGTGKLPIGAISLLLCKIRQSTVWDGMKRGIIDIGSVEKPGRIMNQAYQLGRGSAMLDRRQIMNMVDLKMVTKVLIDTMPQERWRIVKAMYSAEVQGAGVTDTGVIRLLGSEIAKGRLRVLIDELVAIGMVVSARAQANFGKRKYRRLFLAEPVKALLDEAFAHEALRKEYVDAEEGQNLNVEHGRKWITHDTLTNDEW
jgi:hypothetical protein